MNYKLLRIEYKKWCPLPGSLVGIKGQTDLCDDKQGNCHPVASAKNGWQWIPESKAGQPVLLLGFCNPWCMRILSRKGIFDTNINNLAFVLVYDEQKPAKEEAI